MAIRIKEVREVREAKKLAHVRDQINNLIARIIMLGVNYDKKFKKEFKELVKEDKELKEIEAAWKEAVTKYYIKFGLKQLPEAFHWQTVILEKNKLYEIKLRKLAHKVRRLLKLSVSKTRWDDLLNILLKEEKKLTAEEKRILRQEGILQKRLF